VLLFSESPPPGYMSEDGDSQAVGMYVHVCNTWCRLYLAIDSGLQHLY